MAVHEQRGCSAYTALPSGYRVAMDADRVIPPRTRFVRYLNRLLFHLRVLRREALFADAARRQDNMKAVAMRVDMLCALTKTSAGVLKTYEPALVATQTQLHLIMKRTDIMRNPAALLCAIDPLVTSAVNFTARLDSRIGTTWGAQLSVAAL